MESEERYPNPTPYPVDPPKVNEDGTETKDIDEEE